MVAVGGHGGPPVGKPLTEGDRVRRRDTFLADAADYAAVRPGYPAEAMALAVELARLAPGDPVLEVGCGTGQATEWLADAGFRVLALERSEAMARLAAERLRDDPGVEVRVQDFELVPPEGAYAAVWCATSYHWLDPERRAERCAGHLRPGGALVLLWHVHPPPYTGYFERVQPIYRRWVPEWAPPPSPGMVEERIRGVVSELEESGRFDRPERRDFAWERTYARDDYLRLLHTYSDHRLLPEQAYAGLVADVSALIDDEFGGRVTRPYRTELVVARRRDGPEPRDA